MRIRTFTGFLCPAGLLALVLAGCGGSVEPATALPQARELIASGDSAEARVRLKNLLVKHPGNVEARVLLARIALDSGDGTAADHELSALDRGSFNDAEGQLIRWRTDLAKGRHAEVLAALDGGEVRVSKSEAALLRAGALRGSGNPLDALVVLRSAAKEDPSNHILAVELANTLVALGNRRQAEVELTRFIEAHGPQADVLSARGEVRIGLRLLDKALDDLKGAIAAAPADWPFVVRISTDILMGEAAVALGRLDLAKEQLAKITDAAGAIAGSQLLAARIALSEGRSGDAMDTLQQLANARPEHAQTQHLLVEALLRGGNTARAIDILQKRLQSAPGDVVARMTLARALLLRSQPNEAIDLLDDIETEVSPSDREAARLLAEARAKKRSAQEAISELNLRLEDQPDDPDLRAQLAAALLANGEPQRALAAKNPGALADAPALAVWVALAANWALAKESESNQIVDELTSGNVPISTLLYVSDNAVRAGRSEVSRRLAQRVLQREPANVDAQLRLARLDLAERPGAARSALESILAKHPGHVPASIELARAANRNSDRKTAHAVLSEAVKQHPNAVEPATLLASLELDSGREETALQILDRLVAAAAPDGQAAHAAGALMLQSNKSDRAQKYFETAVEQRADAPDSWFNLASAQTANKELAAALDSLSRAVRLRPDWLQASLAATRLSLELGDRARARQLAEALRKQLPQSHLAALTVGDVAMADGRYADAVTAYAESYAVRANAAAAAREHEARLRARAARPDEPLLKWLSLRPEDLLIRRQLVDHYLRSGASQQAQAQLQVVLEQAPADVGALNNLAWLTASSDRSRAEVLARRAHAIAPDSAAVKDTLGWVLVSAGKFDEAEPLLEQASKELPKDKAVRFHYALALARLGKTDAARRTLQDVLTEDDAPFTGRAEALQLAKELGT